jgi:cytochrome c biogenesis protein CcmG, thiol:disulfide interchange protein DsbE
MTATEPSPTTPRRGLLVIGAVVALVAIALVVALVSSGGDDDGEAQSSASTTIAAGGIAPAEQQPVTVTGADLAPLERDATPETDPAIGATPPVVAGFGTDGTPIEIAPGGTDKVVVFLAHWCPHCNREVPRILEWQEQGMMPEGLELVSVATATDELAPNYPPSKWLADFEWPFATMADSKDNRAAQAYGVTGFPFFVIVGEDGTVKGRFSGESEVEELDALVRAALAS